jgi:tetratricopeptide (TPR) repeat protein
LGSYYEKKGEIDQAIHFYEKSAKLSPESHILYGALSVLYERKGWKSKSKEAYDKFLKYAPGPSG